MTTTAPTTPTSDTVAVIEQPTHVTYQLQRRKCGKPTCSTCRDGEGHGPYWYAYFKIMTADGMKLRSKYIGKRRPAEADEQRHYYREEQEESEGQE